MAKPILCLDFDGVIHSYRSGWKGADVIPDPPVEGALAFMLTALDKFDVVIFSSRSNQKGGIDAMKKWLKGHAGNCWNESPCGPGIEDVRFVKEKPPALVTIDDRALTFTGKWPTLNEIASFRPWNKLGPTQGADARPVAISISDDDITKAASIYSIGNPRFDQLRGFVNHVILMNAAAYAPIPSDAHPFALMCDALPADFSWGDPLTPDVFRHIESALATRDAAPSDSNLKE